MASNLKPVVMEGVEIIFRNFSGRITQYNQNGERNFGVILPDDIAEAMARDGWNVKVLNPREEGDEPRSWLPVEVKFKGRPPQVFMITSRGRTGLGEDEVSLLDHADISKVDLIVNPYEWVVNNKGGIKAYLKSLYVTVEEDELALKYAEMDEARRREDG